MKTTLEVPDDLMRDVKRYAAEQGIPIRAVFERGARQLIEGKAPSKFKLQCIPMKGEGMVTDPSWENIRAMIYEGRGG